MRFPAPIFENVRHLLLVFSLILASNTARANLIVNGSFELVGAAPGSPASTYTADYKALDANTFTGWSSSPGNGTAPANYLSAAGSSANWIPDPFSGSYSVQLDSSTDTS